MTSASTVGALATSEQDEAEAGSPVELGEVVQRTRREVVDARDVVAAGEQLLADVAPDEARSACDEDPFIGPCSGVAARSSVRPTPR